MEDENKPPPDEAWKPANDNYQRQTLDGGRGREGLDRTEIPMTRVALYARYSTDNQREASIEDQLRLCRERAQREGWQIVETYADAAISGASMILRPGIKTLLADAQGGRFDVVMAEALERLSRDQEDIVALFKRLRFAGVRIVTLSEGGGRTACRPQAHHERAFSSRPCGEDQARPDRSCRQRLFGRRPVLRLSRGEEAG